MEKTNVTGREKMQLTRPGFKAEILEFSSQVFYQLSLLIYGITSLI
jgi:hypothetical protein